MVKQLALWGQNSRQTKIMVSIGIACGLIIGLILWRGPSTAKAPATTDPETGTASSTEQISVEAQLPGDVVLVSRVVTTAPRWLVIHDDQNGQPGNALGAAFLPQAGSLTDQKVELLRSTVDENTYLAVLHEENGDGEFDPKTDLPVKTKDGKIISTTFPVVAQSSRGD